MENEVCRMKNEVCGVENEVCRMENEVSVCEVENEVCEVENELHFTLTCEEANNLCPECDHIQLVEGNVKQRHETIKALKEDTLHHQRGVPLVYCPTPGEKGRKKKISKTARRRYHWRDPSSCYLLI